MVSSEGSTPSAGAGSVAHGPGSDDTSGPGPSGAAGTVSEPGPGVVIRSSGGALTSELYESQAGGPDAKTVQSESDDSTQSGTSSSSSTAEQAVAVTPTPTPTVAATVEPTATPVASPVPVTPAVPSTDDAEQLARGWSDVAAPSSPARVELRAVDPRAATMLGAQGGRAAGGPAPALDLVDVPDPPELPADDRRSGQQAVSRPSPAASEVSLRIVTGVLAAALAPFLLPVPGSPVQEPSLWVIFAWARRQSERAAGAQRPLLAAARQGPTTSRMVDPTVLGERAPDRVAQTAEATVTDTIDVGEGLTYGLAVVGDRLYVLNSAHDRGPNGFVAMIDTATRTVAGMIEVGSMPFALAVTDRRLYVGNAGDGSVSVIDVATNRVVDRIDVGATPFGLEVAGGRLYVADHAGTVSVVDLDDNTEIARIPIEGDPFGVAATADRVYVTDYVGDTVAVLDQAIDAAPDRMAMPDANPIGMSGYPYVAAVLAGRLYVANAATNALTVVDRSVSTVVDVDPATRAVDAIPPTAAPVDIIVRGDRLYVGNVNCGTVTVIDVSTNQPVETVRVGIQPGLMAATADGRTIYVADVMDGTVRVITSVRPDAIR